MTIKDTIGNIMAGIMIIILFAGIPFCIAVLFIFWINPITVLEQVVTVFSGTILFIILVVIDVYILGELIK